jgi:hypothetical protein
VGKILKMPKVAAPPRPEQPFPEVALRWLQLGAKGFVDDQLERARAEQHRIKDEISTSVENYRRLKIPPSKSA